MKFLIRVEGNWSDVEVKNSALLEVYLPNEAVVLKKNLPPEGEDDNDDEQKKSSFANGIQSVVLDPSPECVAKLLSLAVDHIDTLLEDWYPTLGTRFVHTSEGKFLVTRLVPCPACLDCHGQLDRIVNPPQGPVLPENWGSFVEMNPLYCSMTGSMLSTALKGAKMEESGDKNLAVAVATASATAAAAAASAAEDIPNSPSPSVDSAGSDGDSGVGPDSTSSSRNPSVEGRPDLETKTKDESSQELTPVVYSFMAEECILAAHSARAVSCPLHGQLLLSQIAPDTVNNLGFGHFISLLNRVLPSDFHGSRG